MKHPLLPIFTLTIAGFALISQPAVHADTFVVGEFNQFTIDFVDIGDTNNSPDDTTYGAVPYAYRISKYEISHETLLSPGLRNVTAGPWTRKKPAASISWYEAAAFVNWLNTNSGYQAAYNLAFTNGAWSMQLWDGADAWTAGGTNLYRHKNARYFLPSENEWYKAAYYNPADINYFDYPTGSDTPPLKVGGGTNANTAVYGLKFINQSELLAAMNEVDGAGSLSPYGTMGQGGSIWEWIETAFDRVNDNSSDDRTIRGGYAFSETVADLLSSTRVNLGPTQKTIVGFRVAATPLQFPTLAVESPESVVLSNSANVDPFSPTLLGSSSAGKTVVLRNTGTSVLGNITVSKYGPDSPNFLLVPPTTNSLAPGELTTFSVSFSPASSGLRTAQISVVSSDANNSPFIINLSGFGLGEDLDSDSDGLNDFAEFTMSSLGFDWQSNQPTLVTALYSNANRAKLFTQLQYDANRTAGRQDVIGSPMTYGLYDSNSIMDLRMGGLIIQRQGTNATVVFQTQSTTDLAMQPFTNNGTPITNTIPMPGNKGFLRIQAR